MDRIQANSSFLVIAGSETTATLLSGVTYLLLTNPRVMEKLVAEIRGAFKSEDEINFTSVSNLPYLLACLDEAMRIYPPGAVAFPRVVPEGGANIAGNYIPEKVGAIISPKEHSLDLLTLTGETDRSGSLPLGHVPQRCQLQGSFRVPSGAVAW